MTTTDRGRNDRRFLIVIGLLAVAAPLLAGTVPVPTDSIPVVTNVEARQRLGTFLVDITYDLQYTGGEFVSVSADLSTDGGVTFPHACTSVTGAVGTQLVPGLGRTIVWDAQADLPDYMGDICRIRVVADTELEPPWVDFWKSNLDGSDQVAFADLDTIGFGRPFRLGWYGIAPAFASVSPMIIAMFDTVPPLGDAFNGFKYWFPDDGCDPGVEDCWHPRMFDEATGDSISYFSQTTFLDFRNDGSGPGFFGQFLPSGVMTLRVNGRDIGQNEIRSEQQAIRFVINHDPETVMLDGQNDWAHPEDTETYPYYVRLSDPDQTHHPFHSGDIIPDRSYVVVKALARDDPRDLMLDPDGFPGAQAAFEATIELPGGGAYSFASTFSELGTAPAWEAGADGWFADTTGFMPAPRADYLVTMRAVDEHGRTDSTPATLAFSVGYPPCVQGVELLPDRVTPSAFDVSLPCYDPDDPGHPAFGDTTTYYLRSPGMPPQSGRDDLTYQGPAVLAVDKITGFMEVPDDTTGMSFGHYLIPANLYRMDLLLHGQDDADERWDDALMRVGSWRYQVDYACDPDNRIHDGPGADDITTPFWGTPGPDDDLEIDAAGVWRLAIDVAAPTFLLQLGPEVYRTIYLTHAIAGGDQDIADWLFTLTTRQFGEGLVQAVAMDQTQCGAWPERPARYHVFDGMRPPLPAPPAGMTWRDCDLAEHVDGVLESIPLDWTRMASNGEEPVVRYFRLVAVDDSGIDFVCDGSGP